MKGVDSTGRNMNVGTAGGSWEMGMVQCRMMDSHSLLASCLHAGPISVSEARHSCAERKYGLPDGTAIGFLKAVCQKYGACGVLAVDADKIIGKIRFWPEAVLEAIPNICLQSKEGLEAIAAFDICMLPSRQKLPSGSIYIDCIQLVPEYRGRGITRGLMSAIIEWARENGWASIRAKAIPHIRPLLDWTGLWSVDYYKRLGFQMTNRVVSRELKQGVTAMRAGDHGKEVQRQWDEFADLSDDEASWCYEVVLYLRP